MKIVVTHTTATSKVSHHFHGVKRIGDDISLDAMQLAFDMTGRCDCIVQYGKMFSYLNAPTTWVNRSYSFSGPEGFVRIEVVS